MNVKDMRNEEWALTEQRSPLAAHFRRYYPGFSFGEPQDNEEWRTERILESVLAQRLKYLQERMDILREFANVYYATAKVLREVLRGVGQIGFRI